jgi:alkylation response protein AidB-like acyl-CoA dehydrogenase
MATVDQASPRNEVAALLAAVQALEPQIHASREQMERERRLPLSLVQAMAQAGLFRMCVPRSLGGLEVEPGTFVRVVEAAAMLEGAVGWCLFVGAGSGLQAAYLPEDAAREIYGRDPNIITCGVYAPKGQAVPVDGGYRVTGRWPLASGSQHSAWLAGNCVVSDGERSRSGVDGAPESCLVFFPSADCQILDTWHSSGLRGTGSHDIAVADIFVPHERSFPLFTGRSQQPGPLYRGPVTTWQFAASAGAPLGIARTAITALTELAGSKTSAFQRGLLREQVRVQVRVAQAEVLLRSARAFLFEALDNLWDSLTAGHELAVERSLLLRLASVHAAESAVQAVELMYRAAGSSSVYAHSTLDRCMRDAHTVAQHVSFAPVVYERAGRVFLGLPPEPPAS